MKYRECSKPTCNQLVPYPEHYCPKHKLENEQQREQERKEKVIKRINYIISIIGTKRLTVSIKAINGNK